MATNRKKIEKTKKNLICDRRSSEKYFDATLEYYKHQKSKAYTTAYNFHTINHIELTNNKKHGFLFKFEGIPKLNEQTYQVDLYERTFRYCDYSYKYLVLKLINPKEESNQNVDQNIEKPVNFPFSKLFTSKINNKLRTVEEIEESEISYKEDEGTCLVHSKLIPIEDSCNDEKNEIGISISEPISETPKNYIEFKNKFKREHKH